MFSSNGHLHDTIDICPIKPGYDDNFMLNICRINQYTKFNNCYILNLVTLQKL